MIETVLSIPLIGIVFAMASQVMMTQVDSYEMVASRQGELTDARYSLNRVADELLYLKTSDVLAISSNSISFVDKDGNDTSFSTTVNGSTTSLMRGTDELLSGISSFQLTYLDSTGTSTNDMTMLRQIQISITTKAIGTTPGLTLSTTVIPRNFVYASYQ